MKQKNYIAVTVWALNAILLFLGIFWGKWTPGSRTLSDRDHWIDSTEAYCIPAPHVQQIGHWAEGQRWKHSWVEEQGEAPVASAGSSSASKTKGWFSSWHSKRESKQQQCPTPENGLHVVSHNRDLVFLAKRSTVRFRDGTTFEGPAVEGVDNTTAMTVVNMTVFESMEAFCLDLPMTVGSSKLPMGAMANTTTSEGVIVDGENQLRQSYAGAKTVIRTLQQTVEQKETLVKQLEGKLVKALAALGKAERELEEGGTSFFDGPWILIALVGVAVFVVKQARSITGTQSSTQQNGGRLVHGDERERALQPALVPPALPERKSKHVRLGMADAVVQCNMILHRSQAISAAASPAKPQTSGVSLGTVGRLLVFQREAGLLLFSTMCSHLLEETEQLMVEHNRINQLRHHYEMKVAYVAAQANAAVTTAQSQQERIRAQEAVLARRASTGSSPAFRPRPAMRSVKVQVTPREHRGSGASFSSAGDDGDFSVLSIRPGVTTPEHMGRTSASTTPRHSSEREREKGELVAQVVRLTAERENADRQAMDLERRITGATAELDTRRKELGEAKRKHEASAEQVSVLTAALMQRDEKIQTLSEELRSVEHQVADTNLSKEHALGEHVVSMKDLTHSLEATEKERTELKELLDSTHEELCHSIETSDTLRRTVLRLEDEVKELKTERSQLTTSLAAACETEEELTRKCLQNESHAVIAQLTLEAHWIRSGDDLLALKREHDGTVEQLADARVHLDEMTRRNLQLVDEHAERTHEMNCAREAEVRALTAALNESSLMIELERRQRTVAEEAAQQRLEDTMTLHSEVLQQHQVSTLLFEQHSVRRLRAAQEEAKWNSLCYAFVEGLLADTRSQLRYACASLEQNEKRDSSARARAQKLDQQLVTIEDEVKELRLVRTGQEEQLEDGLGKETQLCRELTHMRTEVVPELLEAVGETSAQQFSAEAQLLLESSRLLFATLGTLVKEESSVRQCVEHEENSLFLHLHEAKRRAAEQFPVQFSTISPVGTPRTGTGRHAWQRDTGTSNEKDHYRIVNARNPNHLYAPSNHGHGETEFSASRSPPHSVVSPGGSGRYSEERERLLTQLLESVAKDSTRTWYAGSAKDDSSAGELQPTALAAALEEEARGESGNDSPKSEVSAESNREAFHPYDLQPQQGTSHASTPSTAPNGAATTGNYSWDPKQRQGERVAERENLLRLVCQAAAQRLVVGASPPRAQSTSSELLDEPTEGPSYALSPGSAIRELDGTPHSSAGYSPGSTDNPNNSSSPTQMVATIERLLFQSTSQALSTHSRTVVRSASTSPLRPEPAPRMFPDGTSPGGSSGHRLPKHYFPPRDSSRSTPPPSLSPARESGTLTPPRSVHRHGGIGLPVDEGVSASILDEDGDVVDALSGEDISREWKSHTTRASTDELLRAVASRGSEHAQYPRKYMYS